MVFAESGGCKSSFNVLSGTVFERTMVPLPKWFLAIGLMVNAKKSLSSCQLARDVGLNTKTGWLCSSASVLAWPPRRDRC